MAVFGPLQLTTQGQALYTKVQTGTTLTFTRMQIGGGQLAVNQDPTTLTALITPIAYFTINSELANGSTAIIRGIFENTNLTQSTYVCEIGLFAQDPTAGEILYAYANAGTQGDTLPPISDGPISRQFNLNITVGNAASVTVNIPANTYIPVNQMGVANGVPTLDGTGKVPVSQIPSLSYVPTSVEGTANGVATLDSNGKVPASQLSTTIGQTNNFTATQQFTASSASIEANQIILGQTNNVSSPNSPVYLASSNATGVGMDADGNLLPISPNSIPTNGGGFWSILDKLGNSILKVFKDGSKKVQTANNTLDDGKSNMGLGIVPRYGLHQLGGQARLQALSTPSAPNVILSGTSGSTSYTYYVIAVDRNGNKTLPSAGTTITNGNATLNANNYNTISWVSVDGAVSYDILKGNTSTAIATGVTGLSVSDTGQATSIYTAPTRNNTADLNVDGYVLSDVPYVFVQGASFSVSSANTNTQFPAIAGAGVTGTPIVKGFHYGVGTGNASDLVCDVAGTYLIMVWATLSGLNTAINWDIISRVYINSVGTNYVDDSSGTYGYSGLGSNYGAPEGVFLMHQTVRTLGVNDLLRFYSVIGEAPRTINKFSISIIKVS